MSDILNVHALAAENVVLRATLDAVLTASTGDTVPPFTAALAAAQRVLAQPSPIVTAAAELLEAGLGWEASVMAVANATLGELAGKNFIRRATLDVLLEQVRAYRAALNAAAPQEAAT